MRAPSLVFVVALALGVVGTARVADAQQPKNVTEAQRLYDEGKRLYNLGKFSEAVVEFEKAYDLYRAPEFLFNIGQCYRNLRNFEKAIFVFESYLREKPTTDKRQLVEELIAEMRKEKEAEDQRLRQEEAEKMELARRQREAELAVIERRKQAELERIERERAEQASREREAGPPVYKKWWFWTAAGGVALVAIGGIALATGGDELPAGSLGTIDGR